MAIETPDALKGLKGIGGYNDLSKEEKNELLNRYLADGTITKDTKMNVVDRIFRNDLFVQKFGIDEFKKYDAKNRDLLFEQRAISDAMVEKFGEDDENIEFFKNLGLESAKKVLQDNTYITSAQLDAMEKEARNAVGKNMRINNKGELIPTGNGHPAKVSTSAGLLQLTRAIGQFIGNAKDNKLGNISEEESGAEAARISQQLLTGSKVLTRQDVDEGIAKLRSKNAQYIENVYNEENLRIINSPEVVKLKDHIKSSSVPEDQNSIDTLMDKVFINDVKEGKFGSAWYTGFKDAKEMEDFTYDDKREALAKYEALKALGGESYAMVAMNSYFQDLLEKKQRNMGALINRKWANIGTGIISKAAGYVGQQISAVPMIAHLIGDTPEEFNEFMTNSIDTEGKGRNIFNPIYWNYVDQLSTWSPSKIAAVVNNGGVSSRNEVPRVDGEMSAGQYAREGVKMVGYMLPAAIITAISRNVKLPSSVSAANKERLAKGWSWVETTGGALSLANSYAIGTYEQIMTEGMQKINANAARLKDAGYSNEYIDDFQKKAKSRLDMDAKRGMAADWGIEAFRMAILQRTLLSWTKSQPTRDVLNGRYTEVARNAQKELAPKLSKSASMWKKAGSAVFSGFESNYFDDVTVGFGKGVGENRFNDWLSITDNGENLALGAQLANDFLVSLSHGLDGAEKALYDKQSWRDGLIGALGTVIGARVNVANIARDVFSRKGSVSEVMNTIMLPDGTTKTIESGGLGSAVRWLDRYVSTGLTTAMADEAYNYDRTVAMIDWSKDVFRKNQRELAALGNMVKFDEMMRNATSVSTLKTLKSSRDLINYIQLSEWMKDPIMSQLGELMGFNDLMNEAAKGNISEDMLNEYIASDEGAWTKRSNVIDAVAAAREHLKHRAEQFVKIRDTYNTEFERLSDPRLKLQERQVKQIAYQIAMNQSLIDRQKAMASELGVDYKEDMPSNPVAKFGNMENFRAVYSTIQRDYDKAKRNIEEYNKLLEKKKAEARTLADPSAQRFNQLAQVALNSSIAEATARMELAQKELNKKAGIEKYFKTHTSKVEGSDQTTLDVITADEIIGLRPDERAFMLAESNAGMYSNEQQAEINKAKDILTERQSVNAMALVEDSGKLQQLIDETANIVSAERKNPELINHTSNINNAYYDDRFANIARVKDFADKAELLDQVTDVHQGLSLLNKAKYLLFNHSDFRLYKGYVPAKAGIIDNLQKMYSAMHNMLDTVAQITELHQPEHKVALMQTESTIRTAFETEDTVDDVVRTLDTIANTKAADVEDGLFKDALASVVREYNIQSSISEVAEQNTAETKKADEEVVAQTNEKHNQQEAVAQQAASQVENKPDTQQAKKAEVNLNDYLHSIEGTDWISSSAIDVSKIIKWNSPKKPDGTIADYVSGNQIKERFAPAFKLMHDAGIITTGTAEEWSNAVNDGKIPTSLLRDTIKELKGKGIDSTEKIYNALKDKANKNAETAESTLSVCPVCGAKLSGNEESCHQCGTDLKVYHKLNEYRKKAKDGTLTDEDKADLKKSAELLGIPYAEKPNADREATISQSELNLPSNADEITEDWVEDNLVQFNGLSSGRKYKIVYGSGRYFAVVNINGMNVPFYKSSGLGGKKNVESGRWYPFFGISKKGWLNKTTEADINGFYGSDVLKRVAGHLDNLFNNDDYSVEITDNLPSKSGNKGNDAVEMNFTNAEEVINSDLTPTENHNDDTLEKVRANIDKVHDVIGLSVTEESVAAPYVEDQFTVDAEGRGHLIEAPVAEQHTQTAAPEAGYAENQSTFSEDTAENLVGHIVPDYDYKKLSEAGIYEERTGSSPTDVMSRMHRWLKEHSIAIQDIIDNQLGRILKANPSQKINLIRVKDADGQLPFNLLALEYDGVVKRIHKAEEDLVMAQDGKRYLIVGTLGYNSVYNEETGKRDPRNQDQFDAFNFINDRFSKKSTSFFKANKGSSVYVSRDMFTEVADIYAGFITNNLRGESKETRSLSSVLADSSRNPFGYKMSDLKWYIQTETTFLGINIAKEQLYTPIDSEENMGGVFVAVPVPNGNYIPLKIQRTNLSEIKEGTLKNRILGILDRITSADYETRKSALKDFLTYVATRDGYDVLIGNDTHNIITLEENGNKMLTLDMSDQTADVVAFKNAILNSPGFYANLTAGVLSDPMELKIYDDAGCLNITAAKLGTAGVSYTVRPIDASGKPIGSTDTNTRVPSEDSTRLRNTYDGVTIGKETYYRDSNGVWLDAMMEPVDFSDKPQLKINLFYNHIVKNQSPINTKDGIREYIVSPHRNNPILIQVDKDDNITVFNSSNSDAERLNNYIDELTRKIQEKQQEAKILADGGAIIDGELFTKEDLNVEPVGSLDDLINGTPMNETLGLPEEAPINSEEIAPNQPAAASKPEVKPASDNSNLLRQNNSESINFDTLKLNRAAMSELRTILNMPQASIKEIKATLASLDVSLDGITNTPEGIRDWLDYIKNCKIV